MKDKPTISGFWSHWLATFFAWIGVLVWLWFVLVVKDFSGYFQSGSMLIVDWLIAIPFILLLGMLIYVITYRLIYFITYAITCYGKSTDA